MGDVRFEIIKAIGKRGLWKYIGHVHSAIYRASGGRIGHTAGGIANLLLTATGRQSGEPRTVAVTYMPDGDRWILVASNGGRPTHPAWWLNLKANPHARIQVGAAEFAVAAAEAEGDERERLWQAEVRYNPMYAEYAKMTTRRIPVVILQRRGPAA